MTRISNQVVFIPDTEISGLDYLVGTDVDNANKTVSFRVEDLGSHFNMVNGSRNFDYLFYNHIGVSQSPSNGCFYSNNNEQDPNNITHFFISKFTASNKDVSQFFDTITTTNPFDLIISQKIGLNTIFFFSISDVELINGYYKLTVSEVFFPTGVNLAYNVSNVVFNLKPNSASIHNNLSGLNDGDYKHLTALEKTKFDNLPNTFVSQASVDAKQDILTETNFGTFSNSLTTEDDIKDSDKLSFTDSSDSNKQKKTTWLNIKAKLTTVFNTLYQSTLISGTNIKTINGTSLLGSGDLVISGGGGDEFLYYDKIWKSNNFDLNTWENPGPSNNSFTTDTFGSYGTATTPTDLHLYATWDVIPTGYIIDKIDLFILYRGSGSASSIQVYMSTAEVNHSETSDTPTTIIEIVNETVSVPAGAFLMKFVYPLTVAPNSLPTLNKKLIFKSVRELTLASSNYLIGFGIKFKKV